MKIEHEIEMKILRCKHENYPAYMTAQDILHICLEYAKKIRMELNEDCKIPEYTNTPEGVSKQMRINIDILKKEISDHIDSEIERFKKELKEARNEK